MSDTSTFNAEAFLGTATDRTGEVNYFPVPIGEYLGQITKVEGKKITSKTTGVVYTVLEITWEILDDQIKKITELDHPSARQSLFLDMTPEGGLDFGRNRNVQLSRLRDALGQNRKGKAWMPSHLMGGTARLRVVHDINADTGEPRATVNRVTKA